MTKLFVLTLFLGCADFATTPPQTRTSTDHHITRTSYGDYVDEWEDKEHHTRCYLYHNSGDPALSCVKDTTCEKDGK